MLTLDPTRRYDMPAAFGPSHVPNLTTSDNVDSVVLSYETTLDAAAKLIPPHFEMDEKAIVSVARITYRGINYLGGRDYQEIVVAISAVHNGRDGVVKAPFVPVLWVDQVGALMAGREFQGLSKLPAELPLIEAGDDFRRFEASEFGTKILVGEALNLKPLDADKVARVNAGAQEVVSFGWKYIPSPEGGADVDKAIRSTMKWDYKKCWTGESRVEWIRPTYQQAPFSKAAIDALAALPVKEFRRAFVGWGATVIDRDTTATLFPR